MSLQQALSLEIFHFLLIFARIGTAIMFMPGTGERFMPARIRLAMGIGISIILFPVTPGLPGQLPQDVGALFAILATEIFVGSFLGLAARIFITAFAMAGQIIGQIIGLANIFVRQEAGLDGGSVLSGFLMLTGTIFVFSAGLHSLMLASFASSYDTFPPALMPNSDWIASTFSALVVRVFRLSVEMSAPFLVLGLVYNVGLGLVNKMMNQMPVFFVGQPLNIFAGLALLALTIGSMFLLFRNHLADWLLTFQP